MKVTTTLYGGVEIGTFIGGIGTALLIVTFNARVTATAVDAVLRDATSQNVNAASAVLRPTVR